MVFVDGENLTCRLGALLNGALPPAHVDYEKDVFVWTRLLNVDEHNSVNTVRRYYYTALPGPEDVRDELHARLQSLGIQCPRVFPKTKSRASKGVDISISVDMLTHAQASNYDVAVLVTGDQDYVPLVEAVKAAGKQVCIWSVSSGLSPALKRSADHFLCLDKIFLNPDAPRYFA